MRIQLPLSAFIVPSIVAFTPSTFLISRARNAYNRNVVLHSSYQSSYAAYGIDEETARRRRGDEEPNPEENLQSYIPAPEPIASRADLTGKVLVSGYVNEKERTDQLIYDFLNSQESPFEFSGIVAFVNDAKFSKKRLLSRSARYTGLLDKLSFVEAEEGAGNLPTPAQLDGVKHWVATVDSLESMKKIADLLVSAPSIENVSILLTGANEVDLAQSVSVLKGLDNLKERCKYTVIAVGALEDHAEGSRPYHIRDFGTEEGVIPAGAAFSRDESKRLLAECLALESGVNKALTFAEVPNDDEAAKLIKGLREAGHSRPQEIDHMITKGVQAYKDAIEEYKQKQEEKNKGLDPEEAKKIQEERDRQAAIEWEKTEAEFEKRKTDEIEDNARQWAKREYFRRSMGGNMGMTEEEFIESVWERAMFEGDLKYRMMHGGKTDERKELAEFLKKQEAKKEAALRKAKAALEEKLGGVLDDKDDDDKDE